jgi:hypothetical protein
MGRDEKKASLYWVVRHKMTEIIKPKITITTTFLIVKRFFCPWN